MKWKICILTKKIFSKEYHNWKQQLSKIEYNMINNKKKLK